MSGPIDSRNPYEPPTPGDELAIHAESGVGTDESIRSVTFRLSHEDMKGAHAGGFSPSVMIGVVCILTMIGMGLVAVPYLREHGLSRKSEADASGFLARSKALIQDVKPLQVPDGSAREVSGWER